MVAGLHVVGDLHENIDAGGPGIFLGHAAAVITVDDETQEAGCSSDRSEVIVGAADVVGSEDGLAVVAGDEDDLFAERTGKWSGKASTDHIAKKVHEDDIKVPFEKAKLFKGIEPRNDSPSTAPPAYLRASEFNAVYGPGKVPYVAPEDNVFYGDSSFRAFFSEKTSVRVGSDMPPKSEVVESCLGSQPSCSTRFCIRAKVALRLVVVKLLPIPPFP